MYFKTANPAIITVPVSSSARWNPGRPLDAGTLQILQNNLATFQAQHGRTLATQNGGISNLLFVSSSESTKRGFSQSAYAAPTSFATAPTYQQLSWGSDVALKFGPFYIPKTLSQANGIQFTPVNVMTSYTGSAASDLYVAVNGGDNPFSAEPYAIQKVAVSAGTGSYNFEFSGISDKVPSEDNTLWMTGSSDFLEGRLTPVYVWVGVYRPNTDTNFMSITISNPRFV